MSARPFWVLFLICMITIVEMLIIKPFADWRISKSITAMNVPYTQVFKNSNETNSDRVVKMEDIANFTLQKKLDILMKKDRLQALLTICFLGLAGVLGGILLGSVAFRHLVEFGDRLSEWSTTDKITAFMGVLIGLLLSGVFLPAILSPLGLNNPLLTAIAGILVTYVCVTALMSMKEDLKFYVFPGLSKESELDRKLEKPKILDTNVIIDGRISDVCRTGFIEGQILIPSFILEELQHIADSSDSLRRARGRRGLDILNQMRKEIGSNLAIRQSPPVDADNPEEVDARLVKLAKEIDGCIVTNDFNLNKVAELQGVMVFNINELANALKPVVLPGEEMTVTIIKDGKEMNQGIAYLDDGTMVVVEGARKHIGDNLEVTVTSVLQTVAGKMIFANLKSIQEEEEDLIDRNIRNYSSIRPRKKTR
ncbi:MAG: TRAM domain-containing protein [Armatimonadota bacterium]